ncbi:MAG: hypothetical protein S4CHLAM6_04410 [Chlamydiae bacterium]|nr:hypothetical protein [Chlamydiota bacterium]
MASLSFPSDHYAAISTCVDEFKGCEISQQKLDAKLRTYDPDKKRKFSSHIGFHHVEAFTEKGLVREWTQNLKPDFLTMVFSDLPKGSQGEKPIFFQGRLPYKDNSFPPFRVRVETLEKLTVNPIRPLKVTKIFSQDDLPHRFTMMCTFKECVWGSFPGSSLPMLAESRSSSSSEGFLTGGDLSWDETDEEDSEFARLRFSLDSEAKV